MQEETTTTTHYQDVILRETYSSFGAVSSVIGGMSADTSSTLVSSNSTLGSSLFLSEQ